MGPVVDQWVPLADRTSPPRGPDSASPRAGPVTTPSVVRRWPPRTSPGSPRWSGRTVRSCPGPRSGPAWSGPRFPRRAAGGTRGPAAGRAARGYDSPRAVRRPVGSAAWIWTTPPPGSGCPSRRSTACTGSPATGRRLRCPPRPTRPRSSTGSRCGRTTPPRSWRAGPTPALRCGLRSCAGCSTARSPWSAPISAGHGWLSPGPELPRERGPAWRHLYVYAYLALVDVVTGYHRDHGIADAVSWATLADLGRNLAIDRRMHREGWPVMQSWLTLHARGGLYELGRLQHQRGGTAIGLHIPESGPMTPEAVDGVARRGPRVLPAPLPRRALHGVLLRLVAARPATAASTCPRTPTSSGSSGGSSWSPTRSRKGWTPTSRCCGSRSAP